MSKDNNHGEGIGGSFNGPIDFGTPVPGPFVWKDRPEFLPVSASSFARASEVDVVNCFGERIEFYMRSGSTCYANAPYFAAWLDRLGIPWTEELRRAHEADDALRTKADPCQDAPGGGMICTLSRGHALPHRGLWNGEIVRWNPPTHPDARAEDGS